jgi:hypothetical protein
MSLKEKKSIAIISDDQTDHLVIAQAFDGHPDKIEIIETPEGAELIISRTHHKSDHHFIIPLENTPIRIGSIIDQAESLLLRSASGRHVTYKCYVLDWDQFELKIGDRETELTDREREIMFELINAKDSGCNRDYLLNSVWGYRPDLETHTLETHIYRLRQKIEDDPANPKRLITMDNGYKLV